MSNRLTGAFAIIYALLLQVCICLPCMAWLNTNSGVFVAFCVSMLFFGPTVTTYSDLGLNSPEGQRASPETKARRAQLSRACPLWKFVWHGTIVFVFLSWFVAPAFNTSFGPFHGFSVGISFVSGYWLAFVYPIAKSVLTASSTDHSERS